MTYIKSDNIKGFIFDFDGTIVDNMPVHLKSWVEAFEQYNAKFEEDFFYELAGVSLIGVVETYNKRFNFDLDAESVVTLKNKIYIDQIPDQKLVEPVFDIIKKYHNKIPMAIATGSSKYVAKIALEKLDLNKYFKGLVASEDVVNPKPAPDCFLQAAKLINIAPEYCEVFEDGEPGLKGAKAAGMKAIDVREWL